MSQVQLLRKVRSQSNHTGILNGHVSEQSRKVRVELIVNGEPVDTTEITADGKLNDVTFNYPVNHSSWVALRVYPSSHTNPVFIIVDGKPIHERKSAEWCRKAVDQCWKMKQANIRSGGTFCCRSSI